MIKGIYLLSISLTRIDLLFEINIVALFIISWVFIWYSSGERNI